MRWISLLHLLLSSGSCPALSLVYSFTSMFFPLVEESNNITPHNSLSIASICISPSPYPSLSISPPPLLHLSSSLSPLALALFRSGLCKMPTLRGASLPLRYKTVRVRSCNFPSFSGLRGEPDGPVIESMWRQLKKMRKMRERMHYTEKCKNSPAVDAV